MTRNDELSRLLREIDPVASGDAEPDPVRMQRLRARITAVVAGNSAQLPLRWLAAASLLGLSLWWAADRSPAPIEDPVRLAEAREIHFTTAGGTQVIWVLNPAFTITPANLED